MGSTPTAEPPDHRGETGQAPGQQGQGDSNAARTPACMPPRLAWGIVEVGKSGPALKTAVQHSCVFHAAETRQAGVSQNQVCKHGVRTAPATPTHHSALLKDREESLALHSEALLHSLKAGRLDIAVTAGTAPVRSASSRLQLRILTSETAQE